MPRFTLPPDSPFHDLNYTYLGTEDYTRFARRELEVDDQGRIAFTEFTIHTRTAPPVTLEMRAIDFLNLSTHHQDVLARFFNLKLSGRRHSGVETHWNFGRGSAQTAAIYNMVRGDIHPDLALLVENRPARIIPTMLLRAMNTIDQRERAGDADPWRRAQRDRSAEEAEAAARRAADVSVDPAVIEDLLSPARTPAEAAANSLSPSTGLLNSINEAMASIGETFREVTNSASEAVTAATTRRSGGARIPEYATYDRSTRLVNQPAHFGRVADREKWTRFLGRLNRYGTTHAREAGLVGSIYEGTSGQQNSPLVRAWERTGRGVQRMLRANGLELDESVTTAIVKVIAAHAASEIGDLRARVVQRDEALTATRRRVRELEGELREARATPPVSADEAVKAARWDEANRVAVEWSEVPEADAKGKLDRFRRLHHLLTTIAEEAAPAPGTPGDTPAA